MITGPGKWTVTFRPRPDARLRLLCLHHAGGGAYRFRDWAERFPPDIELVAVQLPGRENRLTEPLLTSLEEAISRMAAALAASLQPPFAIFGHSLGAILGYRLSCHLLSSGELELPTHLFVSAARPPQSTPSKNRRLKDTDLRTRLERWGGTPRALLDDPSLLRTFLRPLRADMQLAAGAQADLGRLPIPFTVFRGVSDTSVRRAHADSWSELTSVGAELHELAGGHFYDVAGEGELMRLIAATLSAHLPGPSRAVGAASL